MAFSDWRIQDVQLPLNEAKRLKPDLVVYAGDDVNRFWNKSSKLNLFEEIAKHTKYGLVGIVGNDCSSEDKRILKGEKVFDLHEKPMMFDKIGFLGLEGGTSEIANPIGYTLHNGKYITRHLEQQLKAVKKAKTIVMVSHNPPFEVLDVGIRFGIQNIGSKALRKVILANRRIKFNICGHVHSHGGRSEPLGDCVVVNVASGDNSGDESEGKIALINIDDASIQWVTEELRQLVQCGPSRAKQLKHIGIDSVEKVLTAPEELLASLPGVGKWHISQWKRHAKALTENRTTAYGEITLETNHLFYDIETDLAFGSLPEHVWLIGVFNPMDKKFIQFFEKNPRKQKRMLQNFIDYLEKFSFPQLISYSGCCFERNVLNQALNKYGIDPSLILAKDRDILIEIRQKLFGPFTGYKLKDLAPRLGYKFKHQDLSGFEVGLTYSQYLSTKKEPDWKKFKDYNKDDVMALPFIVNKINEIYHDPNLG
ncbi:MAG: ribonuclease H-like domain-containing protein [Candidatus Micrarchaeia archaeon]